MRTYNLKTGFINKWWTVYALVRLSEQGKYLTTFGITEKPCEDFAKTVDDPGPQQIKGIRGQFLNDCVAAHRDCYVVWLESIAGKKTDADLSMSKWKDVAKHTDPQFQDKPHAKDNAELQRRIWPEWNYISRTGYRLQLKRLKRREAWMVHGIYPC